MKRQIIAFGGGGLTNEPKDALLSDYILQQSPAATPKICFICTATGDDEGYIQRYYDFHSTRDCNPSHLSLFKGNIKHLEEHVLAQDIIYVGGGNTRNMLVLWKEWGLDTLLKKAYENGTILSGVSAGSICWFEEGLTDSDPNQLSKLQCLGILAGSNCPHFDGKPERQPVYKHLIESGEMKAGIACDDGVALHFINEQLERIVSSQANKCAYQFEMKWMLKETVFEATHLS